MQSCVQRVLSLSPPRRQRPGCSRTQTRPNPGGSGKGADRWTHSCQAEGEARRPDAQLPRAETQSCSSFHEQTGTHSSVTASQNPAPLRTWLPGALPEMRPAASLTGAVLVIHRCVTNRPWIEQLQKPSCIISWRL